MLERTWKLRTHKESHSEAAPLPLPQLIWQVLKSRGFGDKLKIQTLMSPRLRDLKHPLSMDQMDRAVARLIEARKRQDFVCVYGDFDLDGTSGLALLVRGLELLGFEKITHYQPSRLTEGYGFHAHAVEKLAQEGVQLIVTVDVGITAFEAADRAKELGVDVVITDHHLPKESLPAALAVVNPNKGFCGSGLGHLCGAGVAYYLFLALKIEMEKQGLLTEPVEAKELLDCFVIGTLTDLVPLVDENRVLVKHGLIELAQTKRPGLKALLQSLDLWGRPLTSQDVAIRFAPKLNALSRMETGVRPIDIFMCDCPDKASALIEEVLKNNGMRLERQKTAESLAFEMVGPKLKTPFVWVWSEHFHKGVVGLVATKMAQSFNVPAFVGSVAENGSVTGSARLPDGCDASVLAPMEFASTVLTKFGGHAAAAGFEVELEKAEAFTQALTNFYEQNPLKAGPAVIEYEATGSLEEINAAFMKWYACLEPFGAEFEAPLFLLKNLEIKSVRELRGGHIKLNVGDRMSPQRLEALWFSPPSSHKVMSRGLEIGQIVDVLAEPQWNHFAGRRTVQLLVRDLKWSK